MLNVGYVQGTGMSVTSNCDFESNLAERPFYDKCVMDIGMQHDTRIKKNSAQTKLGQKKLGAKKLGKKSRHKTLGSKKSAQQFFLIPALVTIIQLY